MHIYFEKEYHYILSIIINFLQLDDKVLIQKEKDRFMEFAKPMMADMFKEKIYFDYDFEKLEFLTQMLISQEKKDDSIFKKSKKEIIKELVCDISSCIYGRSKTNFLWVLINLAYSDDDFSESEKEVLELIVKEFNIDQEIFEELMEYAETLNATIKQIKFFNDSELPYKEIAPKIKELEETKEEIIKSLQNTLDESYLV
ncbi:hypothetical protein CBLAS_1582 [Campylobacter blaseri]|uniref:Co-chaperone DjlA N-terminal domain-containing protein n=1 Tax=Campylobacter blaseri TaxID=2042961 RepID=A0A2P8QZI4_9BACT|nr:hypothetical protein [Campylobacter blaseri]PSM51651.1 hypothetical protein CQ405_07605 [Campylobacter blaseri]PSM53444.1 hypothetical protein CRN67_07610 [Campylobacter blaseri]QKF86740.1 hypothetical protein CBLAS_1582 [Campylobacter blaseri]